MAEKTAKFEVEISESEVRDMVRERVAKMHALLERLVELGNRLAIRNGEDASKWRELVRGD